MKDTQNKLIINFQRGLCCLAGIMITTVGVHAQVPTVPPANTPYPSDSTLAEGTDEHYGEQNGKDENETVQDLDEGWKDFKKSLADLQNATEEQWEEKSELAMDKFSAMRQSVEDWFTEIRHSDVDFNRESELAIETLEMRLARLNRKLDQYDGDDQRKLDRKAGNIEGMIASLKRTRNIISDLDSSSRINHVQYFYDTVDEANEVFDELREALPKDHVDLQDEFKGAIETLESRLDEVQDKLTEQENLKALESKLEGQIDEIKKEMKSLRNKSADELNELSDSVSDRVKDLIEKVDDAG